MFKFVKTAALSALVGLTVFGAAPASAGNGVYFGLGGGHGGPRAGIWLGDVGGHNYRRHDRDRRWNACSPQQAVRVAQRMGLRRTQVQDVSRNSIRVSGRDRGDRVTVRFARAPGCPVISVR